MSKSKIVANADKEPNAEELAKKQTEIFERLGKVTPDQLANFRGKSLDAGRVGEVKAMWEKTVWEK